MPKPGEPKPDSSAAFEAVETTEVIPVDKLVPPKPTPKPADAPTKESAPEPDTTTVEAASTPATPPAPDPEPESPDKKYVAPTTIPTQTVPDHAEDAPKIVLNIPEAKASGPAETRVAEVRARRRAPTVKIARGALGITPVRPIDEDIDVSMDDELPPAVEPPPPLAVLAAPLDTRGEHPRVELPPTETSVDERPARGRSWLAWASVIVLVAGGGLFAALVATGRLELGDRPAATSGSAAPLAASSAAKTAAPAASSAPAPAASETAPPTATATASASATSSAPALSAPPVSQPPRPWPPAGHTAPRPWPPPKATTTSTGKVNPTTI